MFFGTPCITILKLHLLVSSLKNQKEQVQILERKIFVLQKCTLRKVYQRIMFLKFFMSSQLRKGVVFSCTLVIQKLALSIIEMI